MKKLKVNTAQDANPMPKRKPAKVVMTAARRVELQARHDYKVGKFLAGGDF